MSRTVQCFVRAHIALEDGRKGVGASAELMVPKWFDKDPALSNEENIDQLRESLAIGRSVYLEGRKANTAFGHYATRIRDWEDEGDRCGLPRLASAFGPAEIDKAILDALCSAASISCFDAINRNVIELEPSRVAIDLKHVWAKDFLRALTPRFELNVRHTVGLSDELFGHPCKVADGLSESVEEVIEQYGVQWFKLKLSGSSTVDCERLLSIAQVLDRLPDYGVTLDANEQYETLDSLYDLVGRIAREPRLDRLRRSVAFVEQPLRRNETFDSRISHERAGFPILIDEADLSLSSFPRARERGYTGVSSKSCKGLYKSLVNRLRCEVWNRSGPGGPYFLSAEDLTTPSGLAVQQDLALAALLGVAHLERNGHHYIDGMKSAPIGEQKEFLTTHSDLYEYRHGAVRLALHGGKIAMRSLDTIGHATNAHPDWRSLKQVA